MNFGYILIALGVGVTIWMFWGLILFPNGRKRKEVKVIANCEEKRTVPVRNEAADRQWFFDPATKIRVEQAKSDLPILYQKMQILQQQLVGQKVDMSRSEGSMLQHNAGGIVGLALTCLSASDLDKSRKAAEDVKLQIAELQHTIEEKEQLIARYEELAVRYAR